MNSTKLEKLPANCKQLLENFLFDESPIDKLKEVNDVMNCLYNAAVRENSETTQASYILIKLAEIFHAIGKQSE